MSGKTRSALGLAVVLLMSLVPAAYAADGVAAAEVAAVQIDPLAVRWSAQVDAERLVLTVSKPDGSVVRREFAAGEHPVFELAREAAGDGAYTWELRATPRLDAATRKELAEARKRGDEAAVLEHLRQAGRLPASGMVQSGTFRVVNGTLVPADQREGRSAGAAANKSRGGVLNKDQVIADDLIVQGSACIGLDCVVNESFGFDTIRLKENNTRIKFEDTSTGTGFPTHDWQLTANDSASGGAEKFSIEDITASTVPLTVTGGATTNSIFVDSTGRVGFRTSTPVLDLHVNTSNTPAMRLEQNNSGGFTAQTWDIAGNEANFFVRDVTGGSRLPFRIRPGAPTSSIDINASGNVGVGTASPSARLHVLTSEATSTSGKVLFQNTSAVAAAREGMEINNNGQALFILKDTSVSPRWAIGTLSTSWVVDNQGHTGTELTLDQNGNLTVLGTVTPGSSRTIKQDFTSIEPQEVLRKVLALPITTWSYKQDDPKVRHIGPMAEDFFSAFAVGADAKGISVTDSAGVALAAIQGLSQEVQAKDKEIAELTSRIEKLEKLVQTLSDLKK